MSRYSRQLAELSREERAELDFESQPGHAVRRQAIALGVIIPGDDVEPSEEDPSNNSQGKVAALGSSHGMAGEE